MKSSANNIDRIYTWIHCGKIASYNVYYMTGIIRKYYPGRFVPENVKRFVASSYKHYLQPDIVMYKLDHD